MPGLRSVSAIRFVSALREGGSLPGLVEADDDGMYVVKFRGAGQGPKALVADLVGGELARTLGFAVPELVAIEIDPVLGRAEPDYEIRELLKASGGTNLGVDFLPGALPFSPASPEGIDAELAAGIVWLDALITNVDRTARNPNMLLWHDRLWLIDHGAALYRHHDPAWPSDTARRGFPQIRDHVLLPFAASIAEADERLAPRLDEGALTGVIDALPGGWLDGDGDGARRAYVDFLLARLEGPRGFATEAEEARRAVA